MSSSLGINTLSFYLSKGDMREINIDFKKDWKTTSKQIKKYFLGDISSEDYEGFQNEYQAHKNKVENTINKFKTVKPKLKP